MRSELASSLPNGITVFPKRIVFQLNACLDTLHYCIWTNMLDAETPIGIIHEFRKALHQCRIVHPDDLGACDQFMEDQADISKVSTLDIRLNIGKMKYIWYRLCVVIPENPQDRMSTISGFLEPIQGIRSSARRKSDKPQQDMLFRKAITTSSILSLGFDYVSGERLVSNTDVLPQWLSEEIKLQDIINILGERDFSDKKRSRMKYYPIAENPQIDVPAYKPFFRDCRLSDLSKTTEDTRWYRIFHAFIRATITAPICFYLIVTDIHEEKNQEQRSVNTISIDQATGMPNRCAFENHVTEWLECIRSAAEYSIICSVVIVIDQAVDMVAKQGRDYLQERVHALSKIIKAFIHPHEMCGRYGFARFALVLSGTSTESIKERLKMLSLICHSLNSELPQLHVSFGSNLESASQTEQGDIFLEKAYQAVQSEENGASLMKTLSVVNSPAPVACQGDKARIDDNVHGTITANGKRHIFIRTFGHFDVFVDGEAILFNHSKAKELLALLVDRRGGYVGATEAIACLWEEEPANSTTLSRCRKAALHLRETLSKYKIEYLMETVSGKRRILVGNCNCDYYQYLQHVSNGSRSMLDSYLNEYSWAENTVAYEQ